MANTIINVVVARKVPVAVVSNNSDGLVQTNNPVTLRNSQYVVTGAGGGSVTGLTDVISNGNIADGSTLVYSANTGNFIVEPIPSIHVLDGGSF